jgi:hypothetical protein
MTYSSNPFSDLEHPLQSSSNAGRAALAPSELVLLKAERFCKPLSIGFKAPQSNIKVDSSELATLAAAAGVLANEQAGACRLEVGRPVQHGPVTLPAPLLLIPTGPAPAWPDHSLEAAARPLIEQAIRANGCCQASDLTYGWLEKNMGDVWGSALENIQLGLVARGLLQTYVETKMRIFKITHYQLTPQLSGFLSQFPVEDVQRMLNACRTARPQVWKALWEGLAYGFSRRVSDAGPPATG